MADVRSIVLEARPEKLTSPVPSLDHCDHITRTALAGHPQLAADHLLHREMRGRLIETVGNVVRQLNLEFMRSEVAPDDIVEVQRKKVHARQRAYELLIEIAANLAGVESKVVGFAGEEVDQTLRHITQTLERWEVLEKLESVSGSKSPVAHAVVEKLIQDMKKVMAGAGMVAKMGEEIEKGLVKGNLTKSFVLTAKRVVQENVYYRMVTEGLCKFGNDYAIGLRWLRHLGYVQVSTNPVLAARAYDDDPTLWDSFREVVKEHPEWFNEPENFGDEIAMEATKVALWPNLVVYRPIALLSKLHDGMVSYQINPNVAGSLKGSMDDALKIYSSAQEFLRNYDEYLMWGYSNKEERGRPNVVLKVAGNSPAAIDITTSFNSIGMGTNNTVTYTVAQEVTLIMAAMKGMADALKIGIPITQVYETNMGGRLESHLRDLEAERLFNKVLERVSDKEKTLRKLAEGLGALKELEKASLLEEKVRTICSFKYLKSLSHPAFVEIVADARVCGDSREETSTFLSRLENDIGHAGTFVARRVYEIFFTRENRIKWLKYLRREFEVSEAEAEEIMDKIDVLPASKRKPNDTYLTLARRNVTNTEFPDHQMKVLETSLEKGFDVSRFEDAILEDHDSDVLKSLLKLEDFRKAYELTPELTEKLRGVGIEGDFGDGGLKVVEWPTFGPVVKTMNEFTDAYNRFREKTIDFTRNVSKGLSERF
ncbi:MAG: Transaldolase [Candidatus Bathyarchaeota archaeon BA1]|nr:MAG: Transaldolase [Candidatus Bathyarchaeota archaeon BA1]